MKSEAYWEGHQAGCDDAHVRLAAYIDLRREAELEAASQSWIGRSPSHCEAVVERLIERDEIVRSGGSPPLLVAAGRFEQLRPCGSVPERCKSH
jgi:hypothetical protein